MDGLAWLWRLGRRHGWGWRDVVVDRWEDVVVVGGVNCSWVDVL